MNITILIRTHIIVRRTYSYYDIMMSLVSTVSYVAVLQRMA